MAAAKNPRAARKTPVAVPRIDPIAVEAVVDLLKQHEGMLRPPVKCANLLVLIAELHKRRQPLPKRAEVARLTGLSISGVDSALSTRLDEGYLKLRVETPHGNVARRNSAIRERYYEPSPELLAAVEKATKGLR